MGVGDFVTEITKEIGPSIDRNKSIAITTLCLTFKESAFDLVAGMALHFLFSIFHLIKLSAQKFILSHHIISMNEFYGILGIDHDSSEENIKKAYRRLVSIHHPDKGGKYDDFIKIQKAYEALTSDKENYSNFSSKINTSEIRETIKNDLKSSKINLLKEYIYKNSLIISYFLIFLLGIFETGINFKKNVVYFGIPFFISYIICIVFSAVFKVSEIKIFDMIILFVLSIFTVNKNINFIEIILVIFSYNLLLYYAMKVKVNIIYIINRIRKKHFGKFLKLFM